MANYSSIHAWRITWTEEPGGLQSMGSQELVMALTTKPPQTWLMNLKIVQIPTTCTII